MLKTKHKKWKPVAISDKAFSEGLINIEELTDYDINVDINKQSKATTNGNVSPDDEEHVVSTTEESTMPPKNKKRNKKKQNKNRSKIRKTTDISEDKPSENHTTVKSDIKLDLSSWENFNLPDEILKALAYKNFTSPTEIQALTIPTAILKRKDILGAAETGSGKTLAFGIPIVSGILKFLEKDVEMNNSETQKPIHNKLYALIITPTRELAIQVKNHIEDLCRFTKIKVLEMVGGLSVEKQERKLHKIEPHIIVGTPGRVWKLICDGNEHLSQIDDIRYLVIDEADRMMERAHYPELLSLLERINITNENKNIQKFVFSATLSLVHDPPSYIAKRKKKKYQPTRVTPGNKLQSFVEIVGMKKPEIIDITNDNVITGNLEEKMISCLFEDKDVYLCYLMKSLWDHRIMVFCNSVVCVRRLADLLKVLEFNVLPLFADMPQKQRLKNMERFQNNSKGVLLATDVAARGLDIPCVDYVIHYQTPKTTEMYVHRSGRSARGLLTGTSILLCCAEEASYYEKMRETLGKEGDLPPYEIDDNVLFTICKRKVNIARKICDIEMKSRRINSDLNWIEKNTKEMDIELDDDELPEKIEVEEVNRMKRQVKLLKNELKSIYWKNTIPNHVISPRYPTSGILPKMNTKKK